MVAVMNRHVNIRHEMDLVMNTHRALHCHVKNNHLHGVEMSKSVLEDLVNVNVNQKIRL
jgi:hypothetical protein